MTGFLRAASGRGSAGGISELRSEYKKETFMEKLLQAKKRVNERLSTENIETCLSNSSGVWSESGVSGARRWPGMTGWE